MNHWQDSEIQPVPHKQISLCSLTQNLVTKMFHPFNCILFWGFFSNLKIICLSSCFRWKCWNAGECPSLPNCWAYPLMRQLPEWTTGIQTREDEKEMMPNAKQGVEPAVGPAKSLRTLLFLHGTEMTGVTRMVPSKSQQAPKVCMGIGSNWTLRHHMQSSGPQSMLWGWAAVSPRSLLEIYVLRLHPDLKWKL